MKIASAYIEIVNICNLDCRSCYNRSGRSLTRKELSRAEIQQIADRLIGEFGCSYISLAGGEPTLHSEFDGILTDLLTRSDLQQVGVVTNGTTAAEGLIEAYHTYPHLKVQVSLDGSCEEVNAKTRGIGNFGSAVAFLEKLKCSRKSPVVKMVISRNNIQDVEAYYHFAMSMGCEPDFDFINGMGNASDVWGDLEPTAQQKLTVLRTLDRLNGEYGQEAHLPFCTGGCPLANPETELSALIKCNGAVHPCQMLYDDSYALGNILRDDSTAIAEGFARISEIAQIRRDSVDGCAGCLARSNCQRGCMALAVMKTGDPIADDGECTFRKLQILGYTVMKQGVLNDK